MSDCHTVESTHIVDTAARGLRGIELGQGTWLSPIYERGVGDEDIAAGAMDAVRLGSGLPGGLYRLWEALVLGRTRRT